jgi:hypothetical protein
MSQYKAGGASTNSNKTYFNGIDPTGILKDLTLVSIKFVDDKDRLDIEWYQESSGMTGTEYFNGAKPTDTAERISINSGKLVHFLSAFVPASLNEEGKDNRWGDVEMSVDTFKEFCEYHTSKIVIDPALTFDLKKLYSPKKDPVSKLYGKPSGTIDKVSGKRTYPFRDYGKYPFISSANFPNKLNISKDLANAAYPMFIECGFTEIITPGAGVPGAASGFVPPANATAAPVPALDASDDLPF